MNQKQCSASSYSRSQYLPYQELSCLAPLVAPGASKPSKLLLQYPVELSIGVASLWCMPPSLELAFRGASASNTAFLAGLLCHRLLHCREGRRDGGRRGRVRVLAVPDEKSARRSV